MSKDCQEYLYNLLIAVSAMETKICNPVAKLWRQNRSYEMTTRLSSSRSSVIGNAAKFCRATFGCLKGTTTAHACGPVLRI